MLDARTINLAYKEHSTFSNSLGIRCVSVGDGSCEMEAQVRPDYLNTSGAAHGGFLFTLIDVTAGVAASATPTIRRRLVTQSASIYFLHPAQAGETISSVGRVVHRGQTTGLVTVQLFSESGVLLVRSEVSVFYLGDRDE